jgi:hypothetical protein
VRDARVAGDDESRAFPAPTSGTTRRWYSTTLCHISCAVGHPPTNLESALGQLGTSHRVIRRVFGRMRRLNRPNWLGKIRCDCRVSFPPIADFRWCSAGSALFRSFSCGR